MNTAKKHVAKKPQMKAKVSHAGGGSMKMAHGPKVKAHPAHAKPAARHAKGMSGMTSSVKGKTNIPVKGPKGKASGKKGASDQKNPFGHGEVIKFGFK